MIAQMVILLRSHLAFKSLFNIFVGNISVNDRRIARTDDAQKTFVFITARLRDYEGNVHILLLRHSFS